MFKPNHFVSCALLGAVSHAQVDEVTMLQTKSLAVTMSQPAPTGSELLQNVEAMAIKMKDDPSEGEAITLAIGAARSAVNEMIPAIHEEHQRAVNQINIAAEAVEACSSREVDGQTAVAQQYPGVDQHRTDHQGCRQNEAQLIEEMDRACGLFAENLATIPNQICFDFPGGNEEVVMSNLESAKQHLDSHWNNARPLQEACVAAREAVATKQEECAAAQNLFETSFCTHRTSCESLTECREREEENFNRVREEVLAGVEALRAEFLVMHHVNCLLDMMEESLTSEELISEERLATCAEPASTDELNVDIPEFEPLSPCEANILAHAPCQGSFITAEYGDFPQREAIEAACTVCLGAHVSVLTEMDFGELTPPPEERWHLALNLDTDDGNVLNYANADFWENEAALGGATSELTSALTQDYKDLAVFSRPDVEQVLIVVHDEGRMLGWRRWRTTGAHSSLRDYFTAGNTCGPNFNGANSVQLSAETIDAEGGTLDQQHEPLVTNRGENGQLWINAGGGDDWNRLSTSRNPSNNLGWGLGTAYDIHNCGVTMRPQADAQMHTDNHHWGSGGGIGGLIGTDHICGNGENCPGGRCGQCPWTVLSGIHYDYAIFTKYAEAPPAEVSAVRRFNMGDIEAPPDLNWQLALNLDTDDGNVLNYANTEFWEGETELGGAVSDESLALTQDYKDPYVFGTPNVRQVLVVVHNEGQMLGWRRWRTSSSENSLRDYFTSGNVCGPQFNGGNSVQLSGQTLGGVDGTLDVQHEPLVTNRGNNGQLWVNAGGGDDWNRLSTSRSPDNNLGWGLGTAYDIHNCGVTMRPQADAQLHTTHHHWGSGGGIGGLVGTDHICGNGENCPGGQCGQCPWTRLSGLQYDYAIFVTTEDSD